MTISDEQRQDAIDAAHEAGRKAAVARRERGERPHPPGNLGEGSLLTRQVATAWHHGYREAEETSPAVKGLVWPTGGDIVKVSGNDPEATERLMTYWAEGEGAAKIRWATPGDFDRCRHHLGKYVDAGEKLDGLCANLHHRATGYWPGREPH